MLVTVVELKEKLQTWGHIMKKMGGLGVNLWKEEEGSSFQKVCLFSVESSFLQNIASQHGLMKHLFQQFLFALTLAQAKMNPLQSSSACL